jgi:hypothetical protein
MTITEALHKLDPANDSHWTTDGLPVLDVVSKLVGKTVTRDELDPEYCRDVAIEPEVDDTTQSQKVSLKSEELARTIATLEKKRNAISNELRQAQLQYSACLEIEARMSPQNDTKARRAYLEQANARRAERAGIVAQGMAILHGVDPSKLEVRAPIDQAMQRKTGFGKNRPSIRKVDKK